MKHLFQCGFLDDFRVLILVSSPPYSLSKQINPGDNYPDREGTEKYTNELHIHAWYVAYVRSCPESGST
jgi:hypothetical protein